MYGIHIYFVRLYGVHLCACCRCAGEMASAVVYRSGPGSTLLLSLLPALLLPAVARRASAGAKSKIKIHKEKNWQFQLLDIWDYCTNNSLSSFLLLVLGGKGVENKSPYFLSDCAIHDQLTNVPLFGKTLGSFYYFRTQYKSFNNPGNWDRFSVQCFDNWSSFRPRFKSMALH